MYCNHFQTRYRRNMVKGKEFKVIIKKNGHILLNGDLIAILAQWNKYEDIDPESLYEKENR